MRLMRCREVHPASWRLGRAWPALTGAFRDLVQCHDVPYNRFVRSPRLDSATNGVAVDVVDGPITAVTEYLRWTTVTGSFLNLILIGLIAAIIAVVLVPTEAAPYRFSSSG